MRARSVRNLTLALTASLMFWGAYTTIAWIGVPGHRDRLLPPGTISRCGPAERVCAGIEALVPAIRHAVARWWWNPERGALSPFAWFVALSAAGGFGLILIARSGGSSRARRARTGRAGPELSAARVGAAFLALLWLLFTCISLGDNGATPYRRLFTPSAEAYSGAGEEGLQALRANFDDLRTRGCLTAAGSDPRGVPMFDMSIWCMQRAFFTRVLPPFATVALIFGIALGLGAAILRVSRWRSPASAAAAASVVDAAIALALGLGALIVVLWSIARAGGFNRSVIAVVLAALGAVAAPGVLDWSRRVWRMRWTVEWRPPMPAPILGWLLLSWTAFNLLSVVRPFPIGWDDLGLYVNKARALVEHGAHLAPMGTFQWEYLTALGFALYGVDNPTGATAALMINWAAGPLALLELYAFARVYVSGGALLASALFATLPMVAQVSFADLKIDNAVFAMGTLATLCVWLSCWPPDAGNPQLRTGRPGRRDPEPESAEIRPVPWPQGGEAAFDWRLLAMAGVLAGLAFSMKPTAVMLVCALVAALAGAWGGGGGFVGAALLTSALLVLARIDVGDVSSRLGWPRDVVSGPGVAASLALAGGVLLLLASRRARSSPHATPAAVRGLAAFGIALVVLISPWLVANTLAVGGPPGLRLEPPNTVSVAFDLGGALEDAGQPVRRLPQALRMNLAECRATGPQEELGRYWGHGRGWEHYGTLPWRTVMNLDSTGYHVTTSASVLLFPLVLLLPWFWTIPAAWMRYLSATTALLIGYWIVLGNGIPWYGIAIFLGVTIAQVVLVVHAPGRWPRLAAACGVGASLLFSVSLREGQYQATRNHYEYAIGKVTADVVAERVVPHYDDIADIIARRAATMPDRPFTYRVGTFLAYFVPRNLAIMPLADNQLDFFSCLHQERDSALTIRRLQALGFNSLVFDTTTDSIEADPNGTLHRKVRAFLDFVNTPGLGLQVIVNDPARGIAFLLLP
jgi:hypothetical protein